MSYWQYNQKRLLDMKTLNEQIERVRELVRKCYGVVASKNGEVPEVGERNMENLPNAIASTHDTLEELTITQNGEYTPQEGVEGFSKVIANVVPTKKVVLSSLQVKNADIIDGYWAAELVDVSNVTSLSSTFSSCKNLESLNTSNWNTSSLTSLSHLFTNCTKLKTLIGVDKWNVSNVTYMDSVFRDCVVTQFNLNNWDVSKVTRMQNMFAFCRSLQSLDLSNWDVSNCSLLKGMFQGCDSLLSLNISTWNISNNTDLSWMFDNCSSLQSLDVSNWNVSNTTNFRQLFYNCKALQYIDVSTWNVSNATTVNTMFRDCISLKSLIGNRTLEDVLANNICALNGLKIGAADMFQQCNNLDRASLRALINGLADLTGQTTQTLTLNSTLIAKLTEEDIAIATAKNWTIA